MNITKIINSAAGVTGVIALALSASLAMAEVKEKMKIKVVTGDGIAETVTIEDLPIGASEVFITEQGNEVLVSREEEKLTLEVDGRVIDVKLPKVHSVHDDGSAQKRVMFISHEGDLHELEGENVFFSNDKTMVIEGDVDHDVMTHGDGEHEVIIRKRIVSGDDMSEDELAELMEELEIDLEVEAAEGEDHEIIVIKKRVEIHEEHDDN